ncbi:hypothetical protein Hanom_Chr03g00276001 [Helianthus anomalus]
MSLADYTGTWRKTPKGRGFIHPNHYTWSNRLIFFFVILLFGISSQYLVN